jgi:Sec7-like guanine-nucleotide exchange factor
MVTYKVTYSIIRLTIPLPTSKCHRKSWTKLPLSSLTPALNANITLSLSLSSRSLSHLSVSLTCICLSPSVSPLISLSLVFSLSPSPSRLSPATKTTISPSLSLSTTPLEDSCRSPYHPLPLHDRLSNLATTLDLPALTLKLAWYLAIPHSSPLKERYPDPSPRLACYYPSCVEN